MLYKRILPFIIAVFTLPALINAQVTTSSLTGTVKDADGQELNGASISATHQPTGTKYTTVSRAQGNFTITNMRPGGPYLVEVSYVGNRTEKYDDIFLKLAEATDLASTLQKSSTSIEGVVITSAGRNKILNANRTGAVTNIGIREIERSPTVSRSLNDILRITPQSNGASVGGGNYRQNQVTVDGSEFNNTFGIGSNLPAGGSPISLDAIEEFSVSITPYDIRQSGFIGSAVNAVTRSGTNKFTGTAYTFWRNDNFQGDKTGKSTFVKQDLQFNQYGASIGGAIIKNKLFFFANYETEKEVSPGQSRFAATSAAPFGSATNIARPTRTELDDISSFLKSKYDYDTGPYDNYSLERFNKKWLARVDWNINSKNRFNIRYSQVESRTPQGISGSTGGLGSITGRNSRTANNALFFKNSIYYQDANFYSLAAELNSTISSKISNTFRASYTNQNDPRSSDSKVFPLVDILKNDEVFTSFGYEPFTLGNLRDVATYSFVDNISWNTNKHKFIFGAQADMSTTKNGFQPFGQSYYRFASFDDFKNGALPTDFSLTYSLNSDFSQAFPTFKFLQLSAYAQDEISVSKKFRLTLGIRADRTSYPDVTELKTNPLVEALTFANGEKINTGKLPDPKILFSPRLGFNYDVMGDRSLQIRGGTGIFTGRVPFVWIVGQAGNSGMLQFQQAFNTVGGVRPNKPFSPDIAAHRPSTPPPAGTVIPSTVTAFAEDFKNPQTWKTSLAFDKKIGNGFILTMEAIYNKDINAVFSRNVNLVEPTPLNVVGYPDNRMVYPSSNTLRYINKLTNTGQPTTGTGNAFSAIVTGNAKGGYYFSYTTKLEKQFNKNVFGSVAYIASLADNIFDGNGDQPFNTWSLTPVVGNSNVPYLGKADYIVPNRIVATFSIRKEYFKYLGTTLSVYYEGASDGRFSYTYDGDFNRDNTGNPHNDLIYIPRNPGEITFRDRPASALTNNIAYSAKQQSDAFFAYIAQDKYLSKHMGEYAQRNGADVPWRNRVDFKLLQDLFTNIGGKRNTLQFSMNVVNFGNLLNSEWGRIRVVNASQILLPQNTNNLVVGGSIRPEFFLQTDRGNLVSETFRDVLSVSATYSLVLGLRYIFN